MKIHWRKISIISFVLSLLLSIGFSTPSLAHWADLSVAEITVGDKETAIALTFPTGLVAFSDDNQDGQLSAEETTTHKTELEKFLSNRIFLSNEQGKKATVAIAPVETLQPIQINRSTHSTLQLIYSGLQPVKNLKMHYDLFLAEAPAAHCLATIFHQGKVQNFIFNRQNRDFWLISSAKWQFGGSIIVALIGAFFWGAMHAMSPGHGKTIVGAYLMGSKVTTQHALFLGLTTTLTHTIGVFILGLATLFASQFILPERVLPWLSILSGFMVLVIGLNLFISRLRNKSREHHHHHHHHEHEHEHEHHHHHHHHHIRAKNPVTWRNLFFLGISGGLVPCPSALVLLLSAIAIGRVGFGLSLVLAFSLGLALVLTGLGLLLIYGKQQFEKLQLPKPQRLLTILPALSAFLISLIGLGITTQALIEVGLVRL
ncbi:MAG: sulfite exporter TauE/SafE family protein [Cyanobacteria bacterium P01_C01_bin.38]